MALRELWRERWELLRLLRHAGPVPVLLLCAVHGGASLVPSATALAAGMLVRDLGNARELATLLPSLLVIAGVLLLGQTLESLRRVVNEAAAGRIDGRLREQLRAAALGPATIDHLIDPGFADRAARAVDYGGRERARSAGSATVGQVKLSFRVVGALAAVAVVAAFSPVLAVCLLVTSLTIRTLVRRQWTRLAEQYDTRANQRRRLEYWSELAGGAAAAKELRLFGLAEWIMRGRRAAAGAAYRDVWQGRRGVLRRQGWTLALAIGSALAALLVPGLYAMRGGLGTDALVTTLVAAWGIFQISAMGYEAFDIEYGLGVLRAHRAVLADVAATARPVAVAPPAAAGPPLVRYHDVTFRYPGTRRPVLDRLDLEIRPGEVLAVVGINGAGKTTLTKLLAGLHRPSSGCVTVDGTDLATLDPDAWRRGLSVVYQDFVHYPGTVRDNIALAAPEHPVDDDAVRAAADAAGATALIERLPQGLDTPLWRTSAGLDLSGGQWQRLAIARARYAVAHGRTLVVLDEPTAHLDVRAETAFFEQVVAAVRGVSVVLISHRLSTVRHADRIAVLSGGRVTESGDHTTLMSLDGDYARMFRLQAARFHDAYTEVG